jgi:hypothetical protein
MEESGQLQASTALPPGTEPPIPIIYETVWASRDGLDFVAKRKSDGLAGN